MLVELRNRHKLVRRQTDVNRFFWPMHIGCPWGGSNGLHTVPLCTVCSHWPKGPIGYSILVCYITLWTNQQIRYYSNSVFGTSFSPFYTRCTFSEVLGKPASWHVRTTPVTWSDTMQQIQQAVWRNGSGLSSYIDSFARVAGAFFCGCVSPATWVSRNGTPGETSQVRNLL